jgi:hypothetical protein
MHGALIPLFHTRMAIPNPTFVIVYGGPFLALMALWWLANRTDRIIDYLFPHLEWEKSLGWLNIKAERRAKTAFRWLVYAFYFLLAVLLYAIVRIADAFPPVEDWSDPQVLGNLALQIPALVFCLGIWLLYLGGVLLPRLRAEREEAELRKFRAQMAEAEKEREMMTPIHSRVKMPLQKPRTNAPFESIAPQRPKRWDQPGG